LIDKFGCVSLDEAKKNPLKGYVLTESNGKPESDNGVRIGPVDLKYDSEEKMKKYGFDQKLIDKFKPYIGLSGQKAEEALKSKPLELTEEEMKTLTDKMKNFYMPKVKTLPSKIRNDKRVIFDT
jgi:hypothetical protein